MQPLLGESSGGQFVFAYELKDAHPLRNITLTPEQLKILSRTSPGAEIIRGAAGSGKTTTAALRLKSLFGLSMNRWRRENDSSPIQILVLTYKLLHLLRGVESCPASLLSSTRWLQTDHRSGSDRNISRGIRSWRPASYDATGSRRISSSIPTPFRGLTAKWRFHGTVDTQQGSGTFIADKKIEYVKGERQLGQLVGEFIPRAGSAGFTVEQRVKALRELSFEVEPKGR